MLEKIYIENFLSLVNEQAILFLDNFVKDKAHITENYTDFVKLVNELEIEMLNQYLELLYNIVHCYNVRR